MNTHEGARHLRSLRIRDFRGIDDLDLDLRGPGNVPVQVALLAGPNGAGKTAILEAILIALGRPDLLSRTIPWGDQVRHGSSSASIVAEFAGPDAGAVLRCEATLGVGEPDIMMRWVEKRASGELYSDRAPRLELEYFGVARDREEGDSRNQRLGAVNDHLVSAAFRRALSPGPAAASDALARINAHWRRFRAGTGLDVLDVVPRANDPGSGHVVVASDGRRLPPDITSLAMARARAVDRTDIPRLVALDALSSGEKALLRFADQVVFRDRPVGIVLIDEPEQHLHVAWQGAMIHGLQELAPEAQFILATHSEAMLNAVLSYERFIVAPDDDPRAPAAVDTAPVEPPVP